MLFKNFYLLDLDGTVTLGDLRLQQGRITARGALTPGEGEEVVDGRGLKAACVPFFNAHGHGPMTLLRGLGEDKALKAWLEEDIFPREAHLTGEMVYAGQRLALLEEVKGGVAGLDEMYYFYDQISRACDEFGVKLARGTSFNGDFPAGARERLFKDPHAPYTLTLEQMSEAAAEAKERGIGLRTHFLEAQWERGYLAEAFGMTPLEYLKATGLADVNKLVLAHCVYLTADEARQLAEWGNVAVVHNPASNLKLGSGICPTTAFLAQGLPLALGTDGAASNNTLDMWREMQLASLLAKGTTLDPTALNASATLRMATVAGYEAFGFEAPTLQEGSVADLMTLDLTDPSMNGADESTLLGFVVTAGHKGLVRDVVVDGRWVVRDGKVPFDEEEIKAQAALARRQLNEAARKKS